MATKKSVRGPLTRASDAEVVTAFLATVPPAQRAELQAVRAAILAVRPGIGEGIQWNAPSFRTEDDFATFQLRVKQGLQIILHTGAKGRALPKGGLRLDDPAGLVQWLAPDRCLVTLKCGAGLAAELVALRALVQQWLAQIEDLPLAAKKGKKSR